jgi:hypothetical protein
VNKRPATNASARTSDHVIESGKLVDERVRLFHRAGNGARLAPMKNRPWWVLSIVALVAACSSSQKQAWKETGHSFGESGKQTLRAVGESVNPDATNRKEEWKRVGSDFKEAGKDTGRAVSESVDPKE